MMENATGRFFAGCARMHVLVVGDVMVDAYLWGRVERISRRFDRVEHRVQNREFVSHTGQLRGHRLTALSTGIGTDNIDIVLNELDALMNIDLAARTPKPATKRLRIIRLGTCGALQEDIPVDSRIVSAFGVGLDNVLHYYASEPEDREIRLLNALLAHTDWPDNLPYPYVAAGDQELIDRLGHGNTIGITITAGGFYGPQGRQLRLPPSVDGLNEQLGAFAHDGLRIANYEMETSALYGLAGLLGHRACTVCCVVANRLRKEYSKDHHAAVDAMIDEVLERVAP
ncbi:MAG: nucleoside phosphorylase [Flavobacteriales bacterium]